jgi:hypothetical protein
MNKLTPLLAIALTAALPFAASANDPVCKTIHADLVEVRATTGCNPA